MGLFPERGQSIDQIVEKRPEDIKLPESLVKETGAQVIESAVTATVKDGGQQLMQTPQNQTVTIQIPGNQANLTAWSKGNFADSITWLAMFWLRQLKKAIHFGWRIVWGSSSAKATEGQANGSK